MDRGEHGLVDLVKNIKPNRLPSVLEWFARNSQNFEVLYVIDPAANPKGLQSYTINLAGGLPFSLIRVQFAITRPCTMLQYQRLLNLPSCILLEILTRLPIETISQCRYVCKTLRAIILDPYFCKIVLSRPSILMKDNNFSIYRRDRFYVLEFGDNGIVLTEPKTINTNFDPKIRRLNLVGSCNGLVCFSSTDSPGFLYITNPLLGHEYAAVKVPYFDDFVYLRSYRWSYGFGFSPATRQYKVIIRMPGHITGETELHVCTLGTNEWRNLGEVPLPKSSVKFHIDVNSNTGALHWIYRNGSSYASLNAFELGEERNRQIPLPPCLARSTAPMDLVVLGNCLCIYNTNYGKNADIWSMKDYGVAESWTKDHILSVNLSAGLVSAVPVPVNLKGNGGILFSYVKRTDSHVYPPASILVLYHPEQRNFTSVDLPKTERFFKAYAFTGSFLPLGSAVAGEHWKIENL